MIYGIGEPNKFSQVGTEYTDTRTGNIYIQTQSPKGNVWEILNAGLTSSDSSYSNYLYCKTAVVSKSEIENLHTTPVYLFDIQSSVNGILNVVSVVSGFIDPSFLEYTFTSNKLIVYDFNTNNNFAETTNGAYYALSSPQYGASYVWRINSSMGQASGLIVGENEQVTFYLKSDGAITGTVDAQAQLKIYLFYTLS